jgi:quercetin dioxygenase-like cupin family protein
MAKKVSKVRLVGGKKASAAKTKSAAGKKAKAATPPARSRRSTRPKKHVDLKYTPWHTIPLEDLNPLLQRQFVVGQDIMVARVLLKKGCVVPEHSHQNEQLTYIIEGALRFQIAGREIVVSAGEVLCIPSHMPHAAEALVDTVDLDVFTPPRADWIAGTDRYLRGLK